jgi:DNA-binding NarL/FixJ family response regulator
MDNSCARVSQHDTPSSPLRVIIVDDQTAFRHILRNLLERAGWTVVAEAGDIREAEPLVQALQPDIALVDIMLPGLNGIEGAPRLKAVAKDMKIYLISGYTNQAQLFSEQAATAGAEAFILKDDLDLELIQSWKKNQMQSKEETQ